MREVRCKLDNILVQFADVAGIIPKKCVACEFLRSEAKVSWCTQ